MSITRSWRAMLSAMLLFLSAQAPAAPPMQVIENSFESTTFSAALPSAIPARLSVRPCEDCRVETLLLEDSSRYFIGREPLRYAQFRDFVEKNSRGMRIHFDPKTRVITRMVVSG